MQVAVNFQNDAVAQKVLWLLEHFKNDGVEVIYLDDETEIISHLKEGLDELNRIQKGEIKARPVEALLSEL